ncbi:hypothetical protein NA56DRAFT_731138 [Hyaloscypha hepaticicola]|uniref:Uncharacterized protein n=1 Tax=Hyaloscypha hepaticicola TaxID=2082293 RepID=A0A2J6PQK0_9HELO|nr:hypothetical protein NA56DRAFT_731138 [Hyaloscypha hepaticicola]
MLLKRESMRGRRRPGESVPPVSSVAAPWMHLTGPSPSRERADSRTGFLGGSAGGGSGVRLDEEAKLGIHPTSSSGGLGMGVGGSNNPYAGYTGQTGGGGGGGGGGGYRMFPPIAQQPQQRINPLGNQPVQGQGLGQGRRRGESNASLGLGVRKPSPPS